METIQQVLVMLKLKHLVVSCSLVTQVYKTKLQRGRCTPQEDVKCECAESSMQGKDMS